MAVRLTHRDVRAAAATRAAQALAQVRAGLDDLHAWQSSFGSLDLQTNVVGHGVRLAVRGLTLAVQSRSDAVLFEWSERARMLASRIQPVRAPQDPQAVADLAELRAGPTPEREAELRRRIREQAWQRKGSGAVADPVALAELQGQARGRHRAGRLRRHRRPGRGPGGDGRTAPGGTSSVTGPGSRRC